MGMGKGFGFKGSTGGGARSVSTDRDADDAQTGRSMKGRAVGARANKSRAMTGGGARAMKGRR